MIMSKISFVIPCYRSARTIEGVVVDHITAVLDARKQLSDLICRCLPIVVETDNDIAACPAQTCHQRRVLPKIPCQADPRNIIISYAQRVDSMLRYENSYPYIIGLVLRATRNISNVPVNHRSREVGTSGYTMKKPAQNSLPG